MRSAAGFSLSELMAVAFILGLVSVMATPALMAIWNDRQLGQYVQLTTTEVFFARQLAILNERDVHIQFRQTDMCIWYADESPENCLPSTFQLKNGFVYQYSRTHDGILVFTAGRGFAAFTTGRIAIGKPGYPGRVEFILSSLGRLRWCLQNDTALYGIAPCES